jgi:iron complex outermembrane receptor protein
MIHPLVTLPHGWEVDQTYRYVSGLPARHVAGYATVDVRLGWRTNGGLEMSVSGQNLLDGRHLEFAHDPGPSVAVRRSAYASITWRK